MNNFKIGIKDRYPLIDFAQYGSRARRNMRPNVLIGDYCALPLFKDGDILDANAIFNLIKCTRWKEWQSVEKIDEHVANDVIHVTQEDKDRWNAKHEAAQSDWNETDTESISYIKNKPSFAAVAYSGNYSDLTNTPEVPNELADLQDDSTHRLVTDTEKTAWNNKQDAINDLDTIRSGAVAGSTALQPSALNDYYNKTSVDNKLSDKQDVISDLNTIRSGAQAGATAYQKPVNGIPSTDMTSGVQTSLGKADTAYQKPQDGIPSTDMSSAVQTSLGKADTALQQHQDISGKVDTSSVGVANGVAQLDANGKVPSAQLPSYVDDVLEYPSPFHFPQPGETGKIYVDTTFNTTYRWGGSTYVEISKSLGLGETSSTAYAGDKGKAVTDNFNTHAADTDIHVTAAKQSAWDAKSNFSGSYNDLTNKPTIPDDLADLQDDSTHRLVTDTEKSTWNSKSDFSGSYNDLTDKPNIPVIPTNVSAFTNDAGYLTQHQDISGKANISDLATVATSGSYNDLINKPSIPAAQVNSDWNSSSGLSEILNKPTLSTVATSGSYNDLSNKPTIPSIWIGTQAQYNAIVTKDQDTIYIIKESS